MKCCHGNDSHQENEQKCKHRGHISHILMMILCCGGPVIILLLLPLIGKTFPGTSIYLSKVIPFLCPIMMLVMILMMFKKDKGNNANMTCEEKQQKDNA